MLLGFLFWGSAQDAGAVGFALTLLFTPMVLPPVAVGTFLPADLRADLRHPQLLPRQSSVGRFDFLGNKDLAFGATIAVDVWMWTPFMILMTLAALGSVPKAELGGGRDRPAALAEAASGTSSCRTARFILMLGILLRTIDAFKTTDLPYLDDQRRSRQHD